MLFRLRQRLSTCGTAPVACPLMARTKVIHNVAAAIEGSFFKVCFLRLLKELLGKVCSLKTGIDSFHFTPLWRRFVVFSLLLNQKTEQEEVRANARRGRRGERLGDA